ncbi:TlpA family protein disulfide reductase [Bacillus sp. AGMB 02131]|uniref:TlpA family protein disulfide reductase n=1 Tax=Peribacillus faecalis TaxID=2772559 RepID=A0A927CS55_9BACI|nr:TlpA disulfide reductase family protein [Peribacillus faecalis]MBD3106893.1 TlpA family protein disulfide reductase [Peribacillus faecalis]
MKLYTQIPSFLEDAVWLNGEVTNEELEGKPTFIHFWSISCHLCKVAMPKINQFRDQYLDRLNVISVHMPRSESDLNVEEITKQAVEHDISQPTFVDQHKLLSEAYENKYVPAYYLFDPKGKLRHYQAGGSTMKMLENRLLRVLDEAKK